jgi:precorrin-2 methylase
MGVTAAGGWAMLKIVVKATGVALLVIAGMTAISACASQGQVDVSQVRSYADPITENILMAINTGDYVKYSEHFDDTMKSALPEATFQQANAIIKAKIGEYVSKEFWKIETQNQYTIVYYKARFTQESGDVTVQVVFHEVSGQNLVSGLWLDSPNLRK